MAKFRITVVTLMLLACVGCSRNNSRMLPRELEGVWTTDDPRYGDRLLELSQAFVIIVAGHDTPSVQMIDKVETQPKGTDTALTIYSTDYPEETHYEMALQFSPANGGEMRFKNQTQVWRRRSDAQDRPSPSH